MNPDLVEAVARAMAIQNWRERGYSETQIAEWWDTGKDGAVLNKSHYRKRAKAALRAHEEWLASQGLVVVPEKQVMPVRPQWAYDCD